MSAGPSLCPSRDSRAWRAMESRRDLDSEIARQPKSDINLAAVRSDPVAHREAALPGVVDVGAAADAVLGAGVFCPGTAVGRRAFIGRMVAVLDPFPDIADHAFEAEGVHGQGIDRRCFRKTVIAGHGILDQRILGLAALVKD